MRSFRGDLIFRRTRCRVVREEEDDELSDILFGLFYLVAIAVVILHFTGWLEDHNMEWLVFVMAVMVFPVVLLL